MDKITYDVLLRIGLEKVSLISLEEFETEELIKTKRERTLQEYCWTCTSSLILFILKKYQNIETLTYLDADLFFFNDPKIIYNEFNGNSILITEHNFSNQYKEIFPFRKGIYNVQFLIFRNDENSLEALNWWAKKTIEWCYNRHEDGKFGDQAYLNDWSTRFKKVHVLANRKVCLAPWNADKYNVFLKDNEIYVEDTKLIFYHFHTFRILGKDKFHLCDPPYIIKREIRELIYQRYIKEIKLVIKNVSTINPSFNYGFSKITFRQKVKNVIKSLIFKIYRLFIH